MIARATSGRNLFLALRLRRNLPLLCSDTIRLPAPDTLSGLGVRYISIWRQTCPQRQGPPGWAHYVLDVGAPAHSSTDLRASGRGDEWRQLKSISADSGAVWRRLGVASGGPQAWACACVPAAP